MIGCQVRPWAASACTHASYVDHSYRGPLEVGACGWTSPQAASLRTTLIPRRCIAASWRSHTERGPSNKAKPLTAETGAPALGRTAAPAGPGIGARHARTTVRHAAT